MKSKRDSVTGFRSGCSVCFIKESVFAKIKQRLKSSLFNFSEISVPFHELISVMLIGGNKVPDCDFYQTAGLPIKDNANQMLHQIYLDTAEVQLILCKDLKDLTNQV